MATGFLTVSDLGSRLETTDDVNLGSSGWLGTLTLENEATGNIEDVLRVGSSSNNGVMGAVNVHSGADLETGDIEIASPTTGGTNLNGRISVDGNGSKFTMIGAATLNIGTAGAADHIAELEVANDGVFTSGTGDITIGQAGTMEILLDGEFNANGTLSTSSGGTILVDGGTLNANLGLDTSSGTLDFRHGRLEVMGGPFVPVGPTDSFFHASNDVVTLELGSDATFDVGGNLFVGSEANIDWTSFINLSSNARINVSGNAVIEDTGFVNATESSRISFSGDVTVDGGVLFDSTTSRNGISFAPGTTLSILDGGGFTQLTSKTFTDITINVDGVGSVWGDGGVTMDDTLNVTGGGEVFMDTTFTVGNTANATATFDGEGSALTSRTLRIGRNGNTGTITFRNDAEASIRGFDSAVQIATSTTAGTTGNLFIESGAELTVDDVLITTEGGATTTGTLGHIW